MGQLTENKDDLYQESVTIGFTLVEWCKTGKKKPLAKYIREHNGGKRRNKMTEIEEERRLILLQQDRKGKIQKEEDSTQPIWIFDTPYLCLLPQTQQLYGIAYQWPHPPQQKRHPLSQLQQCNCPHPLPFLHHLPFSSSNSCQI